MAGSETYHEYPQPFRIQKRLVLNQCFKCIQDHGQLKESVNYVTFGGEELYDLMDLVSVFDIRYHRLNIVSYEARRNVAEKARICPVASTLSKLSTVSIDIVPTIFFENDKQLWSLRQSGPLIYFLDDTRVFGDSQANTLLDLLRAGLLHKGDWLLITSCLTPRVVRQSSFMGEHIKTFNLFYGAQTMVSMEFRERNHVDLLIAHTFSRYRPVRTRTARHETLCATLSRKLKYRDTRTSMGLWLYHIETSDPSSMKLMDKEFEEFPFAFEAIAHIEEDVPNIFD